MAGMVAESIDAYLADAPLEARVRLESLRALIHELAPAATETIKYGMPTFQIPDRHRIYAAAWAKHVGVYPVHPAPEPLESQLAPLRSAKDTVKFSYAVPFDEGLARELVSFLLEAEPEPEAEAELESRLGD
jgi:uncharacterized protein YdhG (YjbR/CyaY superfamily)